MGPADYKKQPGLAATLWRGVRRRCPVCGDRRIFRTYLKLRHSCGGCGWIVEREPGTVTGAMYLVAVVSQLFAVLVLGLLWLFTDWSIGVMIAVALPVIALFSLAALPVSKGLWIAIEFLTDIHTGKTSEPGYQDRAFEPPRG